MKKTSPMPEKILQKLPPPPVPGGPAVSVPIAQCEEWRIHHGLKVIGCAPDAWPPVIFVVQEWP